MGGPHATLIHISTQEPAPKKKKEKTSSSGPKKKPGWRYQGDSAIASDQVKVLYDKTLRVITGLEHANTAGIAKEMFFNHRHITDVFAFRNGAGWKENGGLAGWSKFIPTDELLKVDKDFKVDGRAPRGKTVKVFIQYLGQRRVKQGVHALRPLALAP